MSRPEKPIDWEKVEHLMMAGCKGTEIAPHFDIHPETFYTRVQQHYGVGFTGISSCKKEQGESLLRVKQFEKALEKDNTMLIWLGKQRLDQREPEMRPPVYHHETDVRKITDKWEKDGSEPETVREHQSLERED